MISVMIVDDEYIVVRGLMQLINWSKYGASVVATASNGEDALEKIRELRPTLVFTDIRMPGISGFELVKQSRRFSPETTFVVISGYNDFLYIRQAVLLKVFDYLDKPLTIEKVEEVMQRFSLDRSPDERRPRFPEQNADDGLSAPVNCGGFDGFIRSLSELPLLTPDAVERFARKFPQYNAGNNQLFGFMPTSISFSSELHGYFSELRLPFGIFTHGQLLVAVVYYDDARELDALYASIEDCCANWQDEERLLCAGMGVPQRGFGEFSDGLFRLEETLQYASFFDIPFISEGELKLSGSSADTYTKLESEIAFHMRANDKGATLSRIDEALAEMESANISRDLFRQECLDILRIGDRICDEVRSCPRETPQYSAELLRLRSSNEVRKWMLDHFDDMLDFLSEQRLDSGKRSILLAKQYVEQHYAESITLQSLSELFHLHPTYFSMLFKETVGENYVRYIHRVRMENAARLLQEGKSVKEAASLCGVVTLRYFTDRFKSFFGITPSQYKRGNGD